MFGHLHFVGLGFGFGFGFVFCLGFGFRPQDEKGRNGSPEVASEACAVRYEVWSNSGRALMTLPPRKCWFGPP